MMENAEIDLYRPIMLEELVGKGQQIPCLPEVYQRVCAQLENAACDIELIGDSIQHDPAITSRILKLVNSGYYGSQGQVSSVVQAVRLLGRERCQHALIGSVMHGVFDSQDDPAFSMQVFWQHSIRTALIARQLAEHIDEIAEPETMFTAGMLHDIGKLLLIEHFPQQMLAVEEAMVRRRIDELTAELTQLGVTHTAVGEALMLHWGLPELLIDCTRYHHEPVHDGPNRHATHLIYLANRLSEYVPPLDDGETEAILDDIENWDMGRLSTQQIASACQNADDLVFAVMESLGMVSF